MRHRVFALLLLCGCASTGSPAVRPDEDILEAVFRHQLENSGGRHYYFLQLPGQQDPSSDFLARFIDSRRRILPASMSKVFEGLLAKYVGHVEDGRSGAILWIGSLKQVSTDTFEVSGGIYYGPLAASGHLYRVASRDGHWTVTDDRQQWMS